MKKTINVGLIGAGMAGQAHAFGYRNATMAADLADRFHLLAYGLALVLMFIGTKMLIVDLYKIPVAVSLGVVAATIGTAMVLSLWIKPRAPADVAPGR